MNLTEFQRINHDRAIAWLGDEQWSLLEWAGAMCGEAGECANFGKKLKRIRHKLPNKEAGIKVEDILAYELKMAKEAADTIIYAVLIINELGFDASKMVADVFDKKSEEYGFIQKAPR